MQLTVEQINDLLDEKRYTSFQFRVYDDTVTANYGAAHTVTKDSSGEF